MRLFLTSCCLVFLLAAKAQTVPFQLKTTAVGVEILILPLDASQMYKGMNEGYRVEKLMGDNDWKAINNSALQPDFLTVFPDKLSKSERILYAKFSPEATPEKGINDPRYKKAMDGFYDLVISNLPSDREGLKRSGLWLLDANGKAGDVYRVSIWTDEVAKGSISLAATFPAQPLQSPEVMGSPNGVNQKLLLHWKKEDIPVGYWLERSVDGGDYKRTTSYLILEPSNDHLPIEFQDQVIQKDSLPIDGKNYQYRVRSVDFFGEVGAPGAVFSIKGTDLRAPAAPQLSNPVVNPKTLDIQLNWSTDETAKAARNYELSVAPKIEGPYTTIETYTAATNSALLLRQSYAQFMDDPTTLFIQITAIGDYGFERPSVRVAAFMPDDTAPPVPQLSATVDTNGIVNLSWTGKRPTDLHKYSIQRRSQLQDGQVEIYYGLPSTNQITDTLDLGLGRHQITYVIAALDKVGNRSAYSEPVRLILPDLIAPSRPVIRSFGSHQDSMLLVWDSTSASDLAKYTLEFQKDNGPYQEWQILDKNQVYAIQGGFETGKYRLRIAAIDSSGNRSDWAATPLIRLGGAVKRVDDRVAIVTAELTNDKQERQLRWSDNKPADHYYIFLQKASEDQLLEMTESNVFVVPQSLPSGSQIYILPERNGQVGIPSKTIEL